MFEVNKESLVIDYKMLVFVDIIYDIMLYCILMFVVNGESLVIDYNMLVFVDIIYDINVVLYIDVL